MKFMKFEKIFDEVKERFSKGEDNFVVDSWTIKKFGNELVASKEGENNVALCISKGMNSPKFTLQASSAYVNIAVETSMDAEAVKKSLCILRSDVHDEMYKQFDCRYAPNSLSEVDNVVRDCDIAAKLITASIEELFNAA